MPKSGVPDGAAWVISFNPQKIKDKAGPSVFQDCWETLYHRLSRAGDMPTKDLWDQYLDLNQRVYLFSEFEADTLMRFLGISARLQMPYPESESWDTYQGWRWIESEAYVMAIRNDQLIFLGAFPSQHKSKADILQELLNKLDKKKTLENAQPSFTSMLGGEGDAWVWYDYPKMLNSQNAILHRLRMLSGQFMEIAQITESVASRIRFEKGKILITSDLYLDYTLLRKYQALLRTKLSEEIYENIPKEAPILSGTFSIGMDGLEDFLEQSEEMSDVIKVTDFMRIDLKSLFNAFSGDIALVFEDIDYEYKNPKIDLVLALGVRNPESLKKVFDRFLGLPFFKDRGKFYRLRVEDQEIYFIFRKAILYITSSHTMRDKLIEIPDVSDTNLDKTVLGKLAHFQISFPRLFQLIDRIFGNSEEIIGHYRPLFEISENLEVTSQVKGLNSSENYIEIQCKDPEKNVLVPILETCEKLLQEEPSL